MRLLGGESAAALVHLLQRGATPEGQRALRGAGEEAEGERAYLARVCLLLAEVAERSPHIVGQVTIRRTAASALALRPLPTSAASLPRTMPSDLKSGRSLQTWYDGRYMLMSMVCIP